MGADFYPYYFELILILITLSIDSKAGYHGACF